MKYVLMPLAFFFFLCDCFGQVVNSSVKDATVTLILKNSPCESLKIKLDKADGNYKILEPTISLGENPVDSVMIRIPVPAATGEQVVSLDFSKTGPGFLSLILQPDDHLKIVSNLSERSLFDHTSFEGSLRTKELYDHLKQGNDLSKLFNIQKDRYINSVINKRPDTLKQKRLLDSLNDLRISLIKKEGLETSSPEICRFALVSTKIYGFSFTSEQYTLLREKFKSVPYVIREIDFDSQMKPYDNAQSFAFENNPIPKDTPLANFILPDANGKLNSLLQYRGKYILVDFWASWCGPCRNESRFLKDAMQRFGNKNFLILSVSIDENHNNWQKAIKEDGIGNFIHLIDDKGWKAGIIKQYGISAIPCNFLIDPNGKIIDKDLRGEDLLVKLFKMNNKL